MSGAEHWESQAERWAMWARRPNFDGYWNDSGPPFFALLPLPGRRTLEVGCGEGRVTRDLKERGHGWDPELSADPCRQASLSGTVQPVVAAQSSAAAMIRSQAGSLTSA